MSEINNSFNPKVLIVEDDPIVAMDLQGMVTRLGYDVVAIVESKATILSAIHRFVPDIILLDMTLNETIDSIDIAKEIHTITDIPIIFCVSSPDITLLTRAKEIAFSSYLLKPINPDSLATALDTAIYKYSLEKRVQKAEEHFKVLASKCLIMQFLVQKGSAFKWTYSQTTESLDLEDIPFLNNITNKQLKEIIIRKCRNILNENSILNFIYKLDVENTNKNEENFSFTVVGVKNTENFTFEGLLLPLDSTSL